MDFKIEEYLQKSGVNPQTCSVDYIQYSDGKIGYTYIAEMVSTVDLDRIYNKFREANIESAILYTNHKPNMIVTDYATRRNIDLVVLSELNSDKIDEKASSNFVNEEGPKVNTNSYRSSSVESNYEVDNNQSKQTQIKDVNDIDSKTYNEKYLNYRPTKDIDQTSESFVEARKISDFGSTGVHIEEKVQSAPPSQEERETKASREAIEKKIKAKSKAKNKQSNFKSTKVILFLVFLGLLVYVPEMVNDFKYHAEKRAHETRYKELAIDPNYVLEPTDILPQSEYSYDDDMENLYNLEIGGGQDYVFNQENNPFPKYASYDDSIELEVGEDIESGIYTISFEGDADVYIDNDISTRLQDKGALNYNIPLAEGMSFDIDPDSEVLDYQVTLTPQKEFVMYEDGLSGMFIYGLTYFDSELQIDYYDNSTIYSYPFDEEINATVYLDRENDTVYGIPGSYINIRYENSIF